MYVTQDGDDTDKVQKFPESPSPPHDPDPPNTLPFPACLFSLREKLLFCLFVKAVKIPVEINRAASRLGEKKQQKAEP